MRYINKKPARQTDKQTDAYQKDQPLSPDLQENREQLEAIFDRCSDIVMKEFVFGSPPEVRGMVIYFDGLTDRKEIESYILDNLMMELDKLREPQINGNDQNLFTTIQDKILSMADVKPVENIDALSHHISSGDTVLLIDGCNQGLAASTRSWQGRPIQTPDNEVVVFGPKEGFSETLRFSTALLRRRLKSPAFKMESMILGRITQTDVVIGYIDGIAPPGMVDEVRKRLSKIDIDGILDTGYLEEFISDELWTIFSQVEHTEKPDRVCAHLLEGRIFIMVDGSPMVLVVPVSFPRFWVSPEDYYTHYIPASLFRILRFFTFWIALLLPSLYVAVITYHHEMVPTALLLTIVATRQGVPFPVFVEAFLLEATFEMLREAGLRLPRAVGPAVSIVGALIIGDAAVRAGLVSTPMVVVVAFTGIASFVTPSYNAGIIVRIARFGFLISAGLLGFLGIMLSLILMLLRMSSLSSFGLPYMAPMAPLNPEQLGDIIVRRPWPRSKNRPFLEGMQNIQRLSSADRSDQ